MAAEAELVLRPTLLPFTPWATRDDYREIFDLLEAHELVGHVDPVQLSIRLLVPAGSALGELCEAAPFDTAILAHPWTHPDPGMDTLHQEVADRVEEGADAGEQPSLTYAAIRGMAFDEAPRAAGSWPSAPRMSEAWYCCAEPTARQRQATSTESSEPA